MKKSMLSFWLKPTTTVVSIAALVAFSGCDNKQTEGNGGKGGETAGGAVAETMVAVGNSVADSAKAFGYFGRVPADADGVSGLFDLGSVWEKVAKSRTVGALLALPEVRENPEITRMLEAWNKDKQLQEMKAMVGGLFGKEAVFVLAKGSAEAVASWMELGAEVQGARLEAMFAGAMGGPNGLAGIQELQNRAILRVMVTNASKLKLPPVYWAFKAGAEKTRIDEFINSALAGLPPELKPTPVTIEGMAFQSLVLKGSMLLAGERKAEAMKELTEMLGSEEDAAEAVKELSAVVVEMAWGWDGDHFILSLGSDHAHVRVAASPSASILTNSGFARRAAGIAAQKPIAVDIYSKAIFAKLGQVEPGLGALFADVKEDLGEILKADEAQAIQADLEKIDKDAAALLSPAASDMVSSLWVEGGLKAEVHGGLQYLGTDYDTGLKLGSLVTPATLLFIDGRADAKHFASVCDFVEGTAQTVLNIWRKYGTRVLEAEQRTGASGVEQLVVPKINGIWSAFSKLSRQGLGTESALVLNLDGGLKPGEESPVPLPAAAPLPRMAWVHEMKSRAEVEASWVEFEVQLRQLLALVPAEPTQVAQMNAMMTIQSAKAGSADIRYFPLPIAVSELLPHAAYGTKHWWLSTSSSFSEQVASRLAAEESVKAGTRVIVNFPALWDFAERWVKVLDESPELKATLPTAPGQKSLAASSAPLFTLLRSIGRLEVTVARDSAGPMSRLIWAIQDSK
jgi:hypothetical protein